MNKLCCTYLYKNNVRCKILNFNLQIGDNYYCPIHTSFLFKKYIIIIQKIYRGYKCRKKLKNIFYKLPRDIQEIVLDIINEPVYYKRYCLKINNIINNKCKNILHYRTNNDQIHIDSIKYTYYMYNKYNKIMDLNDMKFLYTLCDNFIQLSYMLFGEQIFFYDTDAQLFNKITYHNITYSNILEMLSIVNEFKHMYEKEYNIVRLIY